MRIVVNTISTKKHSGGAYQIAYNFLMETLHHQGEELEWYYITSSDVDELVGKEFRALKGNRYFVFPTQPDFKGSYKSVKKDLKAWEDVYKPDVIYTISSPCYFTFRTPEILRFANAWVTNPNKEAWKSMPWKAWLRMKIYRLNQIRMLHKAEYIITQSETVGRGLRRITGLPEENISVVPNVLPKVFAAVQVSKNIDDRWIDINSAAAPVPHKNLNIIPKVLVVLKEEYGVENVRFHLTIPEGHEMLKSINNECAQYGISDRIINHGRCTQQQLIEVYNRCCMCFLPTLLETFSASSLEAMYFGQYIVATDYEFNREVIEDAGVYYKPTDAKDAAQKINAILSDKEMRLKMEERMKDRLSHYNDYDKHFNSILDFLVKVAVKTKTNKIP